MAEIRELGESLLQRAKKRNDDRFKRNKREAYKVALLHAGGGLINKQLENRTSDFLNSEQLYAQRAKQLAGSRDAQFFISNQDAIDAQGITSQEYFQQQMLPIVKEQVMERVREQGMTPGQADSLSVFIREQAAALAEQKAAAHQTGYEAAIGVETPQDFAQMQRMAASRNSSNAGVLLNGVKRLFGGKSRAEIEEQTIQSLERSPALQRATTATEARRAYSQTGDIDLATRVADAIESGDLQEGKDSVIWKARGGVQTVQGPLGEQRAVLFYDQVDTNGNVVNGSDNKPVSMMINKGINFDSSGGDADFSRYIDNLSEGQIAEQSNILQTIATNGNQDQAAVWQAFVAESGEDAGVIIQRTAAIASKMQADHGTSEPTAQKIAAQMVLNRVQAGWQEGGFLRSGHFDFTGVDSSSTPSSLDIVLAIGELENTNNPASFNRGELNNMLGTLVSDIGSLNTEGQVAALENFMENPDKYGFLLAPNASGESAFDVLVDSLGFAQEVEEPVVEVPEAIDESASNEPTRDSGAFRKGKIVRRNIEQAGDFLTDVVRAPFRLHSQLGGEFDKATEGVRGDVKETLDDFIQGLK